MLDSISAAAVRMAADPIVTHQCAPGVEQGIGRLCARQAGFGDHLMIEGRILQRLDIQRDDLVPEIGTRSGHLTTCLGKRRPSYGYR
jgi:hypothetical protein